MEILFQEVFISYYYYFEEIGEKNPEKKVKVVITIYFFTVVFS